MDMRMFCTPCLPCLGLSTPQQPAGTELCPWTDSHTCLQSTPATQHAPEILLAVTEPVSVCRQHVPANASKLCWLYSSPLQTCSELGYYCLPAAVCGITGFFVIHLVRERSRPDVAKCGAAAQHQSINPLQQGIGDIKWKSGLLQPAGITFRLGYTTAWHMDCCNRAGTGWLVQLYHS